jgi:hypothetical protein
LLDRELAAMRWGSFGVPFLGRIEWAAMPERYRFAAKFHGRRRDMPGIRCGGTVWTRAGKLVFAVRSPRG